MSAQRVYTVYIHNRDDLSGSRMTRAEAMEYAKEKSSMFNNRNFNLREVRSNIGRWPDMINYIGDPDHIAVCRMKD